MHPFAQGYTETLQKLAAPISEEDIAAALAGHRNRMISPQEVDAHAGQEMAMARHQKRHSPLIGGAVGGGLGGALGGALGISGGAGRIVGGAAAGLALGGGLGAALGALRRRAAGLRAAGEGRELGQIAQEGQVPRYMGGYLSHQDLVPHALGIQEATAKPLTPEEFAMIRSGLKQDMMAEQGLGGALTGAMIGGAYGGDEYPHAGGALAGAGIGGGMGALEGLRAARARANQLSDLYERGYGHLAGRIYEGGARP